MIKRILVDFDGTIADSLGLVYDLSVLCARRYGIRPIEPDEFSRMRMISMKDRVRMMRFPRWKVPFYMARFFRLYRERVYGIEPFPGIAEVFGKIRESGTPLSVLSSNKSEIIRRFLVVHRIFVFENVYGSAGIFGKSRLIRKVLRAEKLKPEEILYVGDEHRDIEACRACGVRIAAVSWGYDARELLEKENPDFIADSPDDLLRIVESIRG